MNVLAGGRACIRPRSCTRTGPNRRCLQGPLLEAEGKQIGVVTAIAAPAALRVRFSGGGPEEACWAAGARSRQGFVLLHSCTLLPAPTSTAPQATAAMRGRS